MLSPILKRLCHAESCRNLVHYNCCRLYFGQPVPQTHPHMVKNGQLTAGVNLSEFSGRRAALWDKISQSVSSDSRHQDHLAVIPSATKLYMSADIPFPFRQNTDFHYLCGFLEPDSVLVMTSVNQNFSAHKCMLFVPSHDATSELWEGRRSGPDQSSLLTGVDQSFPSDQFESFVGSFLKQHSSACVWYPHEPAKNQTIFYSKLERLLAGSFCGSTQNLKGTLHSLRVLKSQAEVQLMRDSCRIGAESLAKVIQFTRPEMSEAFLQAKMNFECVLAGAQQLGYPPVVAGGNRANTLHYISNNQLLEKNDLILMDAGCEFHGYNSDISRTWPVKGSFSQPQRAVYEAVLEVQRQLLDIVRVGSCSMMKLYLEMLRLLGRKLQELKIIEAGIEGQELILRTREFCPHDVGHYLGMDIHDTVLVSKQMHLLPGMVITIEPGLYIRASRNVPDEFHGIGIRIEDNVLITESGIENLTANCPTLVTDIERLMQES